MFIVSHESRFASVKVIGLALSEFTDVDFITVHSTQASLTTVQGSAATTRLVPSTGEATSGAIDGSDMVILIVDFVDITAIVDAIKVAKMAVSEAALVTAIAILPVTERGKQQANTHFKQLLDYVDTITPIDPRLLVMTQCDTDDLSVALSCMSLAILRCCISHMFYAGLNCTDFADLKWVLQKSGVSAFGFGVAKGPHRAHHAVTNALNAPAIKAVTSHKVDRCWVISTGTD